ncbi:hypothetical protein EXW17_15415 [Enterococcus faecium]|nr:hypothetical protein [Enterococcus faecium]
MGFSISFKKGTKNTSISHNNRELTDRQKINGLSGRKQLADLQVENKKLKEENCISNYIFYNSSKMAYFAF